MNGNYINSEQRNMRDGTMKQVNTNPFATTTEVKIGKQVYIIERHFGGSRSLADAIYEVVKNDAAHYAPQSA